MICQGSNGIEVDPVGVQIGVSNSLLLWCSAGRATVVAVIAPKISASLAPHGDRYSCVVRERGLCSVEEAFEHLDLGTGFGQVGGSLAAGSTSRDCRIDRGDLGGSRSQGEVEDVMSG